jgi:hypothetical protein
MTHQPAPDDRRFTPAESWVARRRRKIREEIERNRRGEAAVPTWLLAVLLVVVVVGWVLFVALV